MYWPAAVAVFWAGRGGHRAFSNAECTSPSVRCSGPACVKKVRRGGSYEVSNGNLSLGSLRVEARLRELANTQKRVLRGVG